MPDIIRVANMRDGLREIAAHVLANGHDVAPRGQRTYEVLDAVIVLDDPSDALPVGIGRKLNPAIAAVEALQLIGGFSDPALMCRVAKSFASFRDSGVFHGAYGQRVRPQLPAVIDRLRRDPDTRQAVIVLWDPLHDLFVPDSRDYPCTTMLQFLIRDGELVLHTTMRSNDVWWGLTYDAFQFTQLQLTIAHVLDLPVGPYHHHAVSLHVYDRDVPAINRLHAPTTGKPGELPYGFANLIYDRLDEVQARARALASGAEPVNMSPSEAWYASVLRAYTSA